MILRFAGHPVSGNASRSSRPRRRRLRRRGGSSISEPGARASPPATPSGPVRAGSRADGSTTRPYEGAAMVTNSVLENTIGASLRARGGTRNPVVGLGMARLAHKTGSRKWLPASPSPRPSSPARQTHAGLERSDGIGADAAPCLPRLPAISRFVKNPDTANAVRGACEWLGSRNI